MGQSEQLQQLVGDPLARKCHQIVRPRGACLKSRRIGLASVKPRVEAEEAKDPQMVFGNSLQGVADEADVALLEVNESTEIVEQLPSFRVGRQRVDREIAPRRVLLPVVRKRDRRSAAVGRDIAPQGRDLERVSVANGGNRAMVDARRHRFDPGLLQPPHHLIRSNAGRKVDVVDGQAKQIVAYRSAHEARKTLVGAERLEQALRPAFLPPLCGVELQRHSNLRDRLTIMAAVAPQILRSFHTIS